ncbi:MAG: MFS transporter, partial [Asgard group archaeon]|nr:MFS transporter [Asgard group archaeon]
MPNEEKKPAKRARKEYAQEVLEIKISKEVKEIEAQETDYKNVFLWAINGLSSGLLYQGLLGIGFVSLVVFLGIQTGYSYFWSFVFLATALGISNILTLFLGLFVGSISDVYGKRKFLVIIFTGISIVFFTFIASWMNFYFTIVLFIIGNTLFQTSRIVY